MTNSLLSRLVDGLRLGCTASLAVAIASCNQKTAQEPANPGDSSPVLAHVAGGAISAADFEQEVTYRVARRQPIASKEALLDEMIERRALIHRAREAGLAEDPAIRRELDNLLISKLRQRELETELRRAAVSEEELRAAYEARLAEFTRPAKVRVALLHLKAGEHDSEAKRAEVRARLEEARDRAEESPAPGGRGGAAQGFGALAIKYSDDQTSRYRGGDIGWLDSGSFDYHWPKEVLEAAYAGEKGKVSDVLEVDGGFYLVMKTDFRAAAVQSFADAKSVLEADLLRAKRARLQDEFCEETMRLAGTTIDREALDAVELPAPSEPPRRDRREARPPALPLSVNN